MGEFLSYNYSVFLNPNYSLAYELSWLCCPSQRREGRPGEEDYWEEELLEAHRSILPNTNDVYKENHNSF